MRTLKVFRALVWLRWRLLKNSLSSGRKRDSLEQVSRALALIVPLLIVAMSVGTFAVVSIVSFVSGSMLADGRLDTDATLIVVRLLVAIMTFTILSLGVVSPTQSSMSRYTRLLLLPIHRRVLHLVEVAAAFADPWVAVVAAGLLMFALGILAGGQPVVAMIVLMLGVLTVTVIVCAASLAGFLVSWLMRDRRRGELFTLVFVLAFSLLSFLPAFFARSDEERRQDSASGRRTRRAFNPVEFDQRLPAWSRYIPSELHGRSTAAAFRGDDAAAATGMVALAVEAALLFALSARVHRRMLNSLEGDQSRRRRVTVEPGYPNLPLLPPAASAVAYAMMRAALRTVRGRLTILLPGPMFGLLTLAFKRVPDERWATGAAEYGFLLFGVCIIFTFYSMQAFNMNFFGSDRAGLTMQLLAPVSDRQLAWGKVVGFAIVSGVGVLVCLATSLFVARSGPPAYWATIVFGAIATFFLLAPVSIWLSALFPVQSDLSKTGSGGNPHPFTMFAGLFCIAVFSAPTLGILAVAQFWFRSPITALPMAALWAAIAAAIGIPLVNLAARTLGSRRENLALVAQGR